MLLTICGLIYMDTAIGVTILSFVLPAAQCDLEMDSSAKGWLTASPMLGQFFNTLHIIINSSLSVLLLIRENMLLKLHNNLRISIGMVIGSYIWGCLADTKGRKIVLIATLLMDGIVGILSSFVQYFWVFLLFRFFNGFA